VALGALRPRGGASSALTGGRALRCALINNMPDSALVATERQFLGLLEVAAGSLPLDVRRYGLGGIPRGPRAAAYLRAEYLPLEHLWESEPDALIITGSEPLAASLPGEPYWAEFVRLLDWAAQRPTSVLLSCLSAHAALFALDGLERVRLPEKCSGVFPHELCGSSSLTAGLDRPALMPHSRYNDVPTDVVAAAGWEVILRSEVGWGAITGRRSQSELLLVQGHPEYGASTLLREFRRDVGRYLRAERTVPPTVPRGCVAAEDRPAIEEFHRAVVAGVHGEEYLDSFAWDEAGARVGRDWQEMAETLYSNWVAGIMGRRSAADRPRAAGR
jgi:homoserine O-succinyltransferase